MFKFYVWMRPQQEGTLKPRLQAVRAFSKHHAINKVAKKLEREKKGLCLKYLYQCYRKADELLDELIPLTKQYK